jgi:hypothetical protein
MSTARKSFADYDAVVAEVERIAAPESTDEPISAATLANVRDLISVCRKGITLPDSLGRGYWPTIRMSWGFVEVEVFEDRLEVYQLKEGQTSIWYEEHNPGGIFSNRFLAELAALG